MSAVEQEQDEIDPTICRTCGDPLHLHPDARASTLDDFREAVQQAEQDSRGLAAAGQGESARQAARRAVRLRCVAQRAWGLWLP